MKAAIRGTEIFFDVAGMSFVPVNGQFEQRPIVFLLHGGPGSDHTRYKRHSLELQQVAQLVFIDHRGCGLSQKGVQSDYTLENNIEDIEALRLYLGIEKITLLGTSYGGMVAQGYATRYASHLDKLILVATAPSYRFLAQAKKYLKQHGSPEQIAICQRLWQGSFESAEQVAEYQNIMKSLYSLHPENFKMPKSESKWCYEALNQGFGVTLRTFDYEPLLKNISCPTLVLAGEKDWISRPQQSKRIAELIPNATLKIFPDCAHQVAIDAHDQYIKAIKEFLA